MLKSYIRKGLSQMQYTFSILVLYIKLANMLNKHYLKSGFCVTLKDE